MPSTITTPPRDWSPGHPSIYPDPDVIVVDPSFRQFAPGNSGVRRLSTGAEKHPQGPSLKLLALIAKNGLNGVAQAAAGRKGMIQ